MDGEFDSEVSMSGVMATSIGMDGEFDFQISMSGVMATSIGILRDGYVGC